MIGRIHSLESFGTVDGPGTRYVVFMQGCPMRCLYCHNPDTWNMDGGREMTTDEILAEYEKGKEFYRKGGLTVTGGEPMMQMEFVAELFAKAKEKGIHTCLDTSGIAFNPNSEENVKKTTALLSVTDLVMLDIKHIDPEEHKKLCSQSIDNVKAFAEFLGNFQLDLWIRHVVVPGITFEEKYLHQLGRYIGTLKNLKALDVLPYHDMGKVKYKNLEMEYPLKDTKPLSKEEAQQAREIILKGIKEIRAEIK